MNIIILLSLAVHLFVTWPKHTNIHIEIKDVGIRKQPLEFHGLFDTRDAANTRTMRLAHLLVARSHAVQQGDPTRTATAGGSHIPFVEHPLDVGRSENIVINPVAVFLLEPGIEKREAGANDHRAALQGAAVGQRHAAGGDRHRFGGSHHFDIACRQSATQLGKHLGRRRQRREQRIPSPELAAQIGLFLDDRRTDAAIRKPQCGLNTGDTAAYDDNLSFHCALIL